MRRLHLFHVAINAIRLAMSGNMALAPSPLEVFVISFFSNQGGSHGQSTYQEEIGESLPSKTNPHAEIQIGHSQTDFRASLAALSRWRLHVRVRLSD